MSPTLPRGSPAEWARLVCVLASLAPTAAGAAPTTERAHAVGVDAYAYPYPLVTMDVTRRQLTNVSAVARQLRLTGALPAGSRGADRARELPRVAEEHLAELHATRRRLHLPPRAHRPGEDLGLRRDRPGPLQQEAGGRAVLLALTGGGRGVLERRPARDAARGLAVGLEG